MNTSMDTIRETGLSHFFKSSMNLTAYAKKEYPKRQQFERQN